MKVKFFVAAALLAGSSTVSLAAPTVFDFESIATGTYSTAAQTVGGLTVTLTGSSTTFDVTSGPPGGDFGSKSILSYLDRGGSPVIANFSATVAGITLYGTDYTPSDTDHVWFQAYSGLNGTGTLLATVTGATCCDAVSFPAGFASYGGGGVNSIVFWEAPGDSFIGALYFDNLTVDSFQAGVPEPASWAMMLAGFGAIGGALRNRRKAAVSFG